MARARNIKPGFFQNDELAELHPLERLAFIGMWTIADFKGCIEYRPKMLKVQILPYDECDMEVVTNNLEKARFIRSYAVQGKRYLKIINFEKHQNPHKNERDAGSEIPDILDQDEIINKISELSQDGTKPDLIGSARADSLVLIPDSLNLIPDSLQNPAPEKPARFDPLKISLPECISPEAWAEWIAYRRERKLTTRQQTMQAQVDELATWAKSGHDPTSVIKTSIAKGWQGLFEPKQGNQNANYSDFVAELTGRNRHENALAIDGQAERVD